MDRLLAKIIATRTLSSTTTMLSLQAPKNYPRPYPGQFIRIACPSGLPIPISVCWANKKAIGIAVKTVGTDTAWLASQPTGAKIDISDPLGNGFVVSAHKEYLLVGGGIGVAPLASAIGAAAMSSRNLDAILCFTTSEEVILLEEFDAKNVFTIVATEDGSSGGAQGRADQVLREHLAKGPRYDGILTCGPKPMLRAVAEIAEEFGVPCQASFEEYMGCGIGACKGCAIRLKAGMKTVCHDGPVFDTQEVIWDD